jgi:hypothetical protein
MSIRLAKQIIYGAFYIVVVLGVLGAIYVLIVGPLTFSPPPVQCVTGCIPVGTGPIGTSTVSVFSTTPGDYTFLAQVINNDTDYGAQVFDYDIDIYGPSGGLITSVPAQSFIYADQNKYLVVPNIQTQGTIDHATLRVVDAAWIASSTLGAIPQFSTQNIQDTIGSSTVSVSGQLLNTNIGSYEKVIVVVLFDGSNGSPIGSSQTELDNVQPDQTVNFSVLYPAVPGINPALSQVIIYALR